MESAKYETGKCYKIMAGSNYFSHECSRSGKVHQGITREYLCTNYGASTGIAFADSAIRQISSARAELGAYQNRLETTVSSLNVFGENMFVGYVLKREGSGWHIDGVLAEDPPVYVVELYDADNNGLFAISSNDTKLPGVTYREFKRKAEEILGGQNYQYEEGNDHIIMTYQKDGVTYQTEIVPKSDGADASYVKNYHVYPAQGKFAYRTVTADTYYLCRLKMTTRQVGTDLWIEKKVAGGAADPKEHFTFVLTKTSLAGTSYSVSYEGIAENDGAGHQETLTFDGNGVARLSLKNGEKARILQMPSGDVQIKEENGDYVTKVTVNGISEKYSDASGIKIQLSSEKTELVFTNQLDAQPPTGAELLSVPYWLMGGTALAGLLGSRITGKRRKDRKKKFF